MVPPAAGDRRRRGLVWTLGLDPLLDFERDGHRKAMAAALDRVLGPSVSTPER